MSKSLLAPALLLLLCLATASVSAQNDAAALKREALKNMNAGRFGEAITLLDQFLREKPGDAEAYRLRGKCYQSRGRLENAVEDLKKATDLDPDNKELHAEWQRAAESLRGKVDTRIDGYKRELAINPNAADTYLRIAQAYQSANDLKAAEQWYDDYLRRADAPPLEILRYCEVLAGASHLQKGETILEQYIQKYPQNAELQSRMGYFLLWQGKYPASQRWFQKALALSPSLAGAKEGLDEARSKEASSRQASPAPREIRGQQLSDSPVDRFTRILRSTPGDEESRFGLVQALVNVNRFDEALQQLDTLSLRLADTVRISERRSNLVAVRDSVFRGKIAENMEMLNERPDNKAAMLRVAGYYGEIGDYRQALAFLDRYLAGLPDSATADERFKYAQYSAWGRQFDAAINALNGLLKSSPGNIDYQLLYGQVSVWAVRDLDQGVRYLNNVVRRLPTHLQALLTLSSALALQKKFSAARQHLDRARAIDPGSARVKEAQAFLDDAVRADAERANFALLETARKLAASGDCPGAVRSYEEYIGRVPTPPRSVMLALADVQSCAKDHRKAIQIYDQLLDEEYDFDVAVMRAKNVLWSGDSLTALTEFTKLREERPDDFNANLYLGDAYQGVGRAEDARELYQGLLKKGVSDNERELVLARMNYLPRTGLSGAFASFPTRVAVSPPFTYYSDNQDFSTGTYGGRVELGVTGGVSVGFGYARTILHSATTTRTYDGLKAQLFVRLSDRLTATGSFGTLSSPGKPARRIGDATIVYEKPGVLRVGGYAEGSDAAVLLYTPYLIDLKYEARVYKLLGSYLSPARWRIQGYFKLVSVSDGNTGQELELRLGREFFDDVSLGYEYLYTDFRRQPPFVPFTNRGRQLYWAPQNLESHYAWIEWQAEADGRNTATLNAKIGYIPSYRATVREIGGEIQHHLTPALGISGIVAIGNTYRFDGGYSFVSAGAALYWTVY